MTAPGFIRRIENRTASIGVVGLGYVGLPVAAVLAEAGFRVHGLERNAARAAAIHAGRSPIEGEEPGLAELVASVVASGNLSAGTDPAALAGADIVLIDVETPLESDRAPRYEALRGACAALGPVLRPGALVIVESTVSPGTTLHVVRPALEAAGARGFHLGHCPERVMPGKLLSNMRTVSRVCGGETPAVAQIMVALYRTIVRAEVDAADCVTAELVKTAENAYRDVNIAFANELALVCESSGAHFGRVRELVNKSPGRNVLLAGAGVGGHCIPKDSWLLVHGTSDARLVPAARAVNDGMPAHVASLVLRGLAAHGRTLEGSRIAVMGLTYLENSDDTRNSPSDALVALLGAAHVVAHDPWVTGGDWRDVVRGVDVVVLMVAHDAYRAIDVAELVSLLRTPVLVDGRRCFDLERARAVGLTLLGVGVPS